MGKLLDTLGEVFKTDSPNDTFQMTEEEYDIMLDNLRTQIDNAAADKRYTACLALSDIYVKTQKEKLKFYPPPPVNVN